LREERRMKAKIVNLLLSLVLVLSLGAVVAIPATADEGPEVVSYNTRYVSIDGDNSNSGKSPDDAWAEIDVAVDRLPFAGGGYDRIIVGPDMGFKYGGNPNPEHIVIDQPVVLQSSDGAAQTVIDVTGQGFMPQVIEITSSGVTVDGFTITGTSLGVYAHGGIENVQILNCIIDVDACFFIAKGIKMEDVKYPIIDNNTIDVGTECCAFDAYGIALINCWESTITNNDIEVEGEPSAWGIFMIECGGTLQDGDGASCVCGNTINVSADTDVFFVGVQAMGLFVSNSPLIEICDNTINSTANGDYWAVNTGIWLQFSDMASITGNSVTTTCIMETDNGGFLWARGIYVFMSNEVAVNNNPLVDVNTSGLLKDTIASITELSAEVQEELANLDEILLNTLGHTLSWTGGTGIAMGIEICSSGGVAVCDNTDVDVDVNLIIRSSDEEGACGGGGGIAKGILACMSPGTKVAYNNVNACSVVDAKVKAAETIIDEVAGGYGESIAVGICLFGRPGYVGENSVAADADLDLTVTSVPVIVVPTETPADESALSLLNSEGMAAISESVVESTESEVIGVQLSAGIPSIEAFSGGYGEAVGIGILLIASDNTRVTGNSPVTGTGDLVAKVSAKENSPDYAWAMGGGLGLGVGILVSDSRGTSVTSNTGVHGTGTADVDVGSEVTLAQTTQSMACGGGDGIGIGILFTGCSVFIDEAEALPEGQPWEGRPEICDNEVQATGDADVGVSAKNLVISQDSCACGEALGLALGIATIFYPCVLIEGNTVMADGEADAIIYSEAVHSYDPTSNGCAAGIGIGIAAIFGCCAEIVGNNTMGTGDAYADVDAFEKSKEMMAEANGGSLGLGEGILVAFSCGASIRGNQDAVGVGEAEACVKADSNMPLWLADAEGMAAGIGKGIVVMFSGCAEVRDCNIAAGEGDACVYVVADADYADADSCGLAADIDIMFICFDHGEVQYNSMVDYDDYIGIGQVSSAPVKHFDAGLFKKGPFLNAQYNWWNDPTGPSGMRPGHGEPLIVCGDPMSVKDIPWLYVPHTIAMDDQTGYFVYPVRLSKGLNTLSTPYALEEGGTVIDDYELPASRTWAEIRANSCISGMYKYICRWDEAQQTWVQVYDDDVLTPLDAWYIYMKQPRPVWLMINSDKWQSDAMPTRTLDVPAGGGWCLISSNPQYDDMGMPVGVALSSIEQTPDGKPGYTQVISPIADSQDPWVFVPGGDDYDPYCTPWMQGFRGYWVWMENIDILVGFGFTPIWIGPF
jgi:hypothetical protein